MPIRSPARRRGTICGCASKRRCRPRPGTARPSSPHCAGRAPGIFRESCLLCEQPACVTVCPTGASYKRAEDGIVLVNAEICIGCKLCSWACPYGAREFDADEGVMKKCTLCIDRIYNDNLAPEERQPACVMVCPTKPRFFGDLADPTSELSDLVPAPPPPDLLPQPPHPPHTQY